MPLPWRYRTDVAVLPIHGDVVELAVDLVNIPSESRQEAPLADAVADALTQITHLTVQRRGNTVIAQTDTGAAERVIIAGHLDTVPAADNLPARRVDGLIYGLGACDMKGGVAVGLHCAATVTNPTRDVTYVFYECEEIEATANGLAKLAASDPHLLAANMAILMEPSNALIEAGCQGTVRAEIQVTGKRAHSARGWMGVNAIHGAGEVLQRLGSYVAREPVIDGMQFREGMNAVGIAGGVAGNVIPDACTVAVNYRFAPDRSIDQAVAHLEEVFTGFPVTIVDAAPGALPGLDVPQIRQFADFSGAQAAAKLGWTDVARFAALGTPALNFGPGDPTVAHTANEHVREEEIRTCARVLSAWLQA
jgi:succinyl-diaminopimelate desuccinylase